jgi:pimeloyl-ACP methyl ester carboxylesterase
MPRITEPIDPAATIAFPNGTVMEMRAGPGSATQFTPEAGRLRSAQLPSERDTSAEFEVALRELGIEEQETLHIDVFPTAGGLRSRAAEDPIVLYPSLQAGDTRPRVVLYQDESGGLSWHFADDAFLTPEQRQRLLQRGLRAPPPNRFVIRPRTGEARATLRNGVPRGSLRGPITKIGRKILKILIIPVADVVLGKPLEMMVRAVEERKRRNLIWQITPETYNRSPSAPMSDWSRLTQGRTLLIVHGILSSVEGMLSGLPRSAMERWCESYQGRVIAFNHLSVVDSPEDNARFFLEQTRQALPEGQLEFDVLCHSRGGIVSRLMAEHGDELVRGCNAAFRSIYFVASPNNGSQLGDANHMVDMVDVFTNFLTNFPDGPVMYSIETLLGIVKMLASVGMKQLSGIASMGTAADGFIATRLNRGGTRLAVRYGAAASDYEARPGADNGFFLARFGNLVMDGIFSKDGQPTANDLVVPRDSVFDRNGHPMFAIDNPLLYTPADAVWHCGFFSQPRTLTHIENHLRVGGASQAISAPSETKLAEPRIADDRKSLRLRTRRGRLRDGGAATERGAPRAAQLQELEVQRRPEIIFHELVKEGQTSDLVVRLADLVIGGDAVTIALPAGKEFETITVELSAPGFTVESPRAAPITVKRKRDPETERVTFRVTAKNPGLKPIVRELIATFWQDNNCIGAVTHETTVVPAAYDQPAVPSGHSKVDALRIRGGAREDADLVIYVRALQPGVFDVALRSRVFGEEYDMKPMGELKLVGTDFEDFFRQVIDPQFSTFPRDPYLTDEEFEEQIKVWNGTFMSRLAALGRRLWTLLPEKLRDEYLRLISLSTPPRALFVQSDEMTLPWEIIRPAGMINGQFEEQPLGVRHVLGRWRPGLGARPQPQGMPIKSFIVLNPRYDTGALYWADRESERLKALLGSFQRPSPVDRKAVEAILNRDDVQMIHFNGHGALGANAELNGLELENKDTLDAMALHGRPLGLQGHPVLYLNACSVGRTGQTLGRPAGFAAVCIESGWSGVIAPYWPVYDPWAADCSFALYTKLLLGRSVGEALQEIRREQPNNFTAQAYSYFGDPWARLLFSGERE